MAPTTKAKSIQAEAQDPNLELTTSSKSTFEHCSRRGPSVKSQDTEIAYEDTANAAANVSAAPAEVPSPAPAVLPKWIVKRRRSGLRTREELEVADFLVTQDFCRRWASGLASDDVLVVAAATMVQLKRDPNLSASATRQGRRS